MVRQDVTERLHALEVSALRTEWNRLYRSPPPARASRSLLELGVAWKIQEIAYGGLSRTTMRRLAGAAGPTDATGAPSAPKTIALKPGARLVREWQGETHDVLVVEGGYEWRGQRWTSLSMIAREITGTRWSGPRFFGLEKSTRKRAQEAGDG